MRHPIRLAAAMLPALIPALAGAQGPGVTPGKWEIAVTITSVDMPGGPAFVAKMMQGKTTRIKQCITPQDAARGPQEMLKSSKTCTFTRYRMAAGRMDSELTCRNGDQVTTSTATGTFTPTGFQSAGRSVTTGSMPMTVTSQTTGKLLGPC